MFEAVLISRLFSGAAYGISYVTVLVHGSEIVNQRQRGMVLISIHFMQAIGITFFGTIIMAIKDVESLHPLRLIALVSIVSAIVGIVVTFIFTEESPVNLIQHKLDQEALQIMIRVRSESEETVAIRNEFTELKTMVEEDEMNNNGWLSDGNSRPIFLIFLMKISFVLSFNFSLNMVILNNNTIVQDGYDITVTVLSIARMLTIVVALFTIEFGRRLHFLIGSTGAGVLLIAQGVLFAIVEVPSDSFILPLTILFQIFSGIGLGFTSDVMASEAFNSLKKANSIAFVTALEYILQMILIAIYQLIEQSNTTRLIILVACGAFMLPITLTLYFKLPETAKMSIRQTRSEFTKRGQLVLSGTKTPAEEINAF